MGVHMKNRLSRLGILLLAVIAIFAVAASPATAKKKPKVKTVTRTVSGSFSQCRNLSEPVLDHTSHLVQFTVPAPAGANPAAGAVTNVSSVGVRVTHTNDPDLVLTLISPGGRVVPLFLGRNGEDLGSGAADCGGTLTTFTDVATTAIGDGVEPFNGSFKPESPLSAFNGGAASGIWTVLIVDSLGGDVGTIHAVSLNLAYQHSVKVKVKKKKKKKK
jgi:subtilisin-like proprotein convertase family protein